MKSIPGCLFAVLLAFFALNLRPVFASVWTDPDSFKCLILVSNDAEPYMEALYGVKEVLESMSEGGVSIEFHVETAEAKSPVSVVKKAIVTSPDLIVSIGTPITDVLVSSGISAPVIYCMVLDPPDSIRNAPGVAGVVLDIPLSEQIAWFRRMVPGIENLAVLYSEDSSYWLEKVRSVASSAGVGVLGVKFTGSSDLVTALSRVSGRAQGLLAIPDGSIYNRVVTPRIIYFSLENRLPFMGLSMNFTRAGALFSLDCDYRDIGRQAGEMAYRIVRGEDIENMSDEYPEKITPVINGRSARILRITINKDVQEKALMINR